MMSERTWAPNGNISSSIVGVLIVEVGRCFVVLFQKMCATFESSSSYFLGGGGGLIYALCFVCLFGRGGEGSSPLSPLLK